MKADICAGYSDLRQTGADRVLAGDKGGTPRRAALLAVEIGECDALLANAVDIRGLVAHLPVAVVTDVPIANVIAKYDYYIWLFIRHDVSFCLVLLTVVSVFGCCT